MKIITTLGILLLTASYGFAQTTLSGMVRDKHGEPVPGANVFLDGTYDGTTTGSEGQFEFISEETGTHTLVIRFVGYQEFKKVIDLNGKAITVQAELAEAVNELEAVAITAGSFSASDESRRTIFRALDIATTAGATADIAGALNTLPGTQKVGESGRLFVRGGEGREARTFIDGMAVLNAYNVSAPNTPSRGRFLPFMFKGVSFSTGGYSAEYGQALSSALVLESKDKAEITRTDVSLLTVGGDVSHTHAWEKASMAAKLEITNLRPYMGLINQRIDWIDPPASVEGSGVFRHTSGKNGMVKVYSNFNRSSLSLYEHAIDDASSKVPVDLSNDYYYVNTAYRNVLGENWMVRGGLSYTYQRNEMAPGLDNFIDTEKGLHAKAVFEGSVSDRVELKTGLEVIDRHYDEQVWLEETTYFNPGFDEMVTAGFVEGDLRASQNFVTRAGARVEHNTLTGKVSVDPRLSLALRTGADGSVSLAYGRFRQSGSNKLLVNEPTLKPEKADHYIASYQLLRDKRTFRVELYHKRYYDLVRYTDGDETRLTNQGDGYARGFEFFWRDHRTLRNTDYWVSYSYLDTKRNYLYYPSAATPGFASAHNFSIVYKHYFSELKTQFGTTYSFASGRPYNNPNETTFQTGKTPAYSDLSVNLAYLPAPNVVVYFSATNLLGRDNVFGYEFSNQPDVNGYYSSRAIRQPARNFLFIGVFITFSKNNTMNQLPAI